MDPYAIELHPFICIFNWKKIVSFLSGCVLSNPLQNGMILEKAMEPQNRDRYLGVIISRNPGVDLSHLDGKPTDSYGMKQTVSRGLH